MNDLITKIQSELPGFSKGQKQIARFILEHYDKAAFMTASRLGVTVGVSESTVVRFATELGYDGYPHLQRALQEMTATPFRARWTRSWAPSGSTSSVCAPRAL